MTLLKAKRRDQQIVTLETREPIICVGMFMAAERKDCWFEFDDDGYYVGSIYSAAWSNTSSTERFSRPVISPCISSSVDCM